MAGTLLGAIIAGAIGYLAGKRQADSQSTENEKAANRAAVAVAQAAELETAVNLFSMIEKFNHVMAGTAEIPDDVEVLGIYRMFRLLASTQVVEAADKYVERWQEMCESFKATGDWTIQNNKNFYDARWEFEETLRLSQGRSPLPPRKEAK